MLHLRIGTLDEAPSLRPQFHSFVASKAEWDSIGDGLPQYEAGRSDVKPEGFTNIDTP